MNYTICINCETIFYLFNNQLKQFKHFTKIFYTILYFILSLEIMIEDIKNCYKIMIIKSQLN